MSLLTTLSYSGLTVTYSIKAETVEHMITRMATAVGLPATSESTGSSAVFSLDLGMKLEQITMNGLVDNVETSTEEVVYPSKTDLEEVCRSWWKFSSTGAITELAALPQLTIDTSETYAVVIKSANFRRIAAQEDRWDYSIIFLVAGKTA